jgi:hypothetical protein
MYPARRDVSCSTRCILLDAMYPARRDVSCSTLWSRGFAPLAAERGFTPVCPIQHLSSGAFAPLAAERGFTLFFRLTFPARRSGLGADALSSHIAASP